jgi:hypothetical protein
MHQTLSTVTRRTQNKEGIDCPVKLRAITGSSDGFHEWLHPAISESSLSPAQRSINWNRFAIGSFIGGAVKRTVEGRSVSMNTRHWWNDYDASREKYLNTNLPLQFTHLLILK